MADSVVTFPVLKDWTGELRPTRRPGGCRIVVKSREGAVLFDSKDCVSRDEAINRYDWFLGEWGPIPERLRASFAAGWVPCGECVEQFYYRRWRQEQDRREDSPCPCLHCEAKKAERVEQMV